MVRRDHIGSDVTGGQAPGRPLIINADDVGQTRAFNEGVRDAYAGGLLTSVSIIVNGSAFEEAVHEVIPECPSLGVGVHLNIVEGRTTRRQVPRTSILLDADGAFRFSFIQLLMRCRNRKLLDEIEADFRDQIDRAVEVLPAIDHLDTHQHSYGIPAIFEIVCRLAREYHIPYVRLPREPWFVATGLAKHCHRWYPINLMKFTVLNATAGLNHRLADRNGVRTNDWFIGVLYTGVMEQDTVRRGLEAGLRKSGIVELLLHPRRLVADEAERFYDSKAQDYTFDPSRSRELQTLLDTSLGESIRKQGWQLTCYACLSSSNANLTDPHSH